MADLQNQSLDKTTDAWNVAQGYTHLKILKPLVEMDKLVKIAKYGCEAIEESLMIPPEQKTLNRIEAINRLIDSLREIVENSDFAMTIKTKDILEQLDSRIFDVEQVLPAISRTVIDQRTSESRIIINDNHFNLCLEQLRTIKREIPDPLNKNSLIFPTSEEVDLDKMKNDLIFGG